MTLYTHQQVGYSLGTKGSLALFWDCGIGKTLVALKLIEHYCHNGQAGRALVVCPLSIIESAWIADCRRFTPHLSIISLWSRNAAERKQRLQEKHDIYICNYETFKRLYNDIQAMPWAVLIVDESSKLKNPRSQITRALLSLAGVNFRRSPYRTTQVVPYRFVLSGTPAPNDESEYWGQMTLVAPGQVFHRNFFVFRGQYFRSIALGHTGQKMWRFNNSMRAEFMDAMKPYAHTVRKADALDLPDQVHNIRTVYLSDNERRAYETLRKELVLEFGNEKVLARTMLAEIMKLRQLTSGFAYGDEGTYSTGTSKLNELKDLLDEIGNQQVIIWCNFRAEMDLLKKQLSDSDTIPNAIRPVGEVCKSFCNKEFQYLIANPASAGHGLTFTNCSYAVYFSLNYSYELHKQSQDRIHRIGQMNKCTYYYLLAENSIDQVIYRTLTEKGNLSESILEYFRK